MSGSDNKVSIYEAAGVERVRRELRLDPQHVRRLRLAFFKKFLGANAALAELPEPVRAAFGERVRFHPLRVHSRHDSSLDGATKLLLETDAGMLVEAVILRIDTGRTTLCVSSQVGCAAACDFCATGRMGIAQNLSAGEILDQLVLAGELLAAEGRRVRNLVLMGMGEPLHNEAGVQAAIEGLVAADGFHHPAGRVLLSTVGIPDAMVRFGRRLPGVNLALSLHSVRQETRERLIPLAKHYPLADLRAAVAELNRLQGRPVMLEFLMLAGMNDSLEEAAELVEWCDGLNVHVNLIPYNPVDDAPHLAGTDRAGREAFAGVLKGAGLTCTIRYSLGADIAAACGQLVRRENRVLARRHYDPHAAAGKLGG
ncbi:MAG: 23S rRNA (adenine(2503)-C(2))-methyltransferase RlmN [Planctomycetota bacterium]